MVHYNELNKTEPQHPGPFSACATISAEIYTFVDQVCNTELISAHLSSFCKRSAQLLKDIKAAVDTVKNEISVGSRHMWVKTEIARYEAVVANVEKTYLLLRAAEKRHSVAMLSAESGS
jgi:hypothetical protein